jgi:hypothetical protein
MTLQTQGIHEGEIMKNPLILIAALTVLTGCVTSIKPTVTMNPPPARALKEFNAFELKPLAVDEGIEQAEAVAKISEGLDRKINVLTTAWSKSPGATLIIEPRIRELKFVGGGKRFFVGALAGSSAVRMTVKLTDKTSGTLIAEPEFYQRAAAYSGAFSIGMTDNIMLDQITTVVQAYMERNYTQAVGGTTGFGGAL